MGDTDKIINNHENNNGFFAVHGSNNPHPLVRFKNELNVRDIFRADL